MADLRAAGVSLDTSSAEAFGEQFFDLGPVVAWSRDDGMYNEQLERMYAVLRDSLAPFRRDYEKDKSTLDDWLPVMQFESTDRTKYIMSRRLRLLVLEFKSHQLTRNDAMDFCHATMAAAYSSIVSLDKAVEAPRRNAKDSRESSLRVLPGRE
jgi:hypothetical protein